MCGVSPTGSRRRLFWLLAVLLVVAAVLYGWYQLDKIDEGVSRRRAVAERERVRQAEEGARRRGVLVRICEDGINGNRSDLRHIVDALSADAAPPADEAEAERRARGQQILDEGLAPIDCQVYVDTGAKVPASTVVP